MSHQRIAADRLRRFSVSVFEAAGAPREHAERASEVLIWASLRGIDTHGIRNLKRYYLDAAGVGRRDGKIKLIAQLAATGRRIRGAARGIKNGSGFRLHFGRPDFTSTFEPLTRKRFLFKIGRVAAN